MISETGRKEKVKKVKTCLLFLVSTGIYKIPPNILTLEILQEIFEEQGKKLAGAMLVKVSASKDMLYPKHINY